MRFSRGIILRGGFGATTIRAAAHFISIFLINAVTLNAQIAPPGHAAHRSSYPGVTAIARHHLRVKLLHEIGGRDAGLAEDLARAFASPGAAASADYASATMSGSREDDIGPAFNSSPTAAPTQRDVERRDLLVSVALQIVERDPIRAAALAESSLAGGLSPHFSRLLVSLRAVDAERTDVVFLNAVGYLEQSRGVDLNGLHTLGAFLVSATDPGAKKSVNRSTVVRFLNCALAQLSRLSQMAAGGPGDVSADEGIDAEDEALIYFIDRQLGGLFARYLPDRLGQFKRRIAELSANDANDRAISPAQVYARNPNEIAREARTASTAADRDLLYARAAFAWLARGEASRAQAAAAKVSAAAIRDRVMIEVARRYNSAGRLDGAVAVARRIEEPVARASLLTSLAQAALASEGMDGATGLLDEATGCALMGRPSMRRALALVGIAASFTEFNAKRGFDVMQTAVKAINEVLAQREASEPARSNPGTAGEFETGELYGSAFEAAYAALGRADFERAWSLAEQLTARDLSRLAQLAVCRGGVGRSSYGEPVVETDGRH
jgi:hypothetical protein